MKVLFQIRVDAFSKFGGDTHQMLQYRDGLRRLGVEAEVSATVRADLSEVDLVHLFNLDRPMETHRQMRLAQARGKPVVVSTIHHRMDYVKDYRRRHREGLLGLVQRLCPSHGSFECCKDFVRLLRGRADARAWLAECRMGQLRQQREIVTGADAVCLLAAAEEDAIAEDFGVRPGRSAVILNGGDPPETVAPLPESAAAALRGMKDFVLVAGRIEAGKNPIGVIEALDGTGLPLVFAGGTNPLHKRYVRRFLRMVSERDNVVYLGRLPPEAMPALYRLAKAHVMASWFEATPLVDIEAAYWGCRAVGTTRSYAPEYAADFALFCDPARPESIRQAVLEAFRRPGRLDMKDLIASRFSWDRACRSLLELYDAVLADAAVSRAAAAEAPV